MNNRTTLGRLVTFEELIDGGVLQELNRRILHPLGLSLAIKQDPADNTFSFNLFNCEDSEGMTYSKLDEDSLRKFRAFEKKRKAIAKTRLEALGFVIQPIPGAGIDDRPEMGAIDYIRAVANDLSLGLPIRGLTDLINDCIVRMGPAENPFKGFEGMTMTEWEVERSRRIAIVTATYYEAFEAYQNQQAPTSGTFAEAAIKVELLSTMEINAAYARFVESRTAGSFAEQQALEALNELDKQAIANDTGDKADGI